MENMVNHSDEQLVLLVAKGSEKAFVTLYERYRSQVFMYVLSLVRDESLAEDFAQETYIKVLLSIREGRYEHDERYLGWVKRIAHNIVFDHFRRLSARNAYDGYGNSLDEVDLSQCVAIIDDSAEEAEQREELLSAVESSVCDLPENQMSVVRQHFWGGLSFKEIASRQKISINTALGRMHYAVTNLRKLLVGKIALL